MQGLGGALVLANVMAEITAVFPHEQRRRAMAVNASVLALGQVTGLVLGGFLIDRLGWRSIFLVILAVGVLGLVLSLLVLRNRTAGPRAAMDWTGAGLSVLTIGAAFQVIERPPGDLRDPVSLTLLLGGLALLGLFVAAEPGRFDGPIVAAACAPGTRPGRKPGTQRRPGGFWLDTRPGRGMMSRQFCGGEGGCERPRLEVRPKSGPSAIWLPGRLGDGCCR